MTVTVPPPETRVPLASSVMPSVVTRCSLRVNRVVRVTSSVMVKLVGADMPLTKKVPLKSKPSASYWTVELTSSPYECLETNSTKVVLSSPNNTFWVKL